MGGVGYELTPPLLGLMQAVGQEVEFRGQLLQLIVAVDADLVFLGVVALAQIANRVHDPAHAPGINGGEKHGEGNHRQRQDQRKPQDRRLQALEQRPLCAVAYHEIYRADGHVKVHDGHAGIAFDEPAAEAAVEHVAALQRLHHRRQQKLGPRLVADAQRIEHGKARLVGDDDAVIALGPQHQHRLLRSLFGDRVQVLEGRGDHAGALHHSRFIGPEDQIAAGTGGVNIQKAQRQGCDDHVNDRVSQLRISHREAPRSVTP